MHTRRHSVRVLTAALVGMLVAVILAGAVQGAVRPAVGSRAAASGPLDLVWISDSVGWGVAKFYGSRIEQDLGVGVRVHDKWEAGLPAATILERLRTPGHPWIGLIRNAEVIVVSGNHQGLYTGKGGNCVNTGCQRPITYGPKTWQQYIAGLKGIYRRIFEIRHGRPVILRTNNYYVPTIAHAPKSLFYPPVSWKQCGLVGVCTKCMESFAWAISRAAAAYRVPVADVYTAFNGKSHREDPVDKGYIDKDGIHQNDAGRAVFAETLAALGYEEVTPRG